MHSISLYASLPVWSCLIAKVLALYMHTDATSGFLQEPCYNT